ncbi:MAG: SDR family NAD(P)-dependent oxidoreductase [Flavobacteriales bacterium]
MKNWTTANIPQRNEGLAVITGSTEGIGFEDAKVLTSKGWTVIMLGRNPQKGEESISKIKSINPKAKISFEKLDLADLSSIKEFSKRMVKKNRASIC